MLKNKSRQKIGVFLKNKFVAFFRFLGSNTWIFTIFFFGTVLLAAVLIWWQCVYRSQPSASVRTKIETEREDFDEMKRKTQEAITFLQGYRDNYNNSDKFGSQRELFVDVLDESVLERLKDAKDVESGEEEGEGESLGDEEKVTPESQAKESTQEKEDEEGDFPTETKEDSTFND